MDWLNPALVASLAGSLALALLYWYLYHQDREWYLALWTLSWFVYAFRFLFQLAAAQWGIGLAATLGDQLATWISGVLLLWGMFAFVDRPTPRWLAPAALGGCLWIAFASLQALAFRSLTFPTFFLLGAIYIWVGLTLPRSPKIAGPGRLVTGWAFILWGVHKWDYPFLRDNDQFAPWGFLLASLLMFAVGVGMILVYYQRTRAALQQRESLFRDLFDHAPLAYQSLDTYARILEVNQTWQELFGLGRAEAIGRSFCEFLVPEYTPVFQQAFSDLLSSGELHNLVMEVCPRDGNRLTVSVEGKISLDDHGRFKQIHCILYDDRQRRQAEQALLAKSSQQTSLVETARHLTENLDLQQVLERIGQGAKDILGANGCTLYLLSQDGQLLHPVVALEDFAEAILAAPLDVHSSFTGQAVKSRCGLIFNDAYEDPAGSYIPGTPEDLDERVIVAPFISNEQVLGAMCLNRLGTPFSLDELSLVETFAAYASTALKNAQDHAALQREVSERLLAEQALSESQERYRSLFEHNRSVMLLLDPRDGQIVDANPAACRFYGFDQATLNSMRLSQIDTLSESECLAQLALAEKEQGDHFLFGHRLASGEVRDVEVFSGPIRLDGKALIYAIVHDVTDRVQREREMEVLHTIDKAITTNFDLDATLEVLLEQITTNLGVDAAAFLLCQGDSQTLAYTAGTGFHTPAIAAALIHLGEGFAGRVAMERNLLFEADLHRNGHVPAPMLHMANLEGFISYVGMPLAARGQVKGVLELYQRSLLKQDPEWWDFLEALSRQSAIAIDNASLFKDLQTSNLELTLAYDTTLEGWARALELRDKETQGHSERVTDLTQRLALAMGMSQEQLVHVRRGTMLHDIGKMGLPDNILLKPGPLSDEEWDVMRQHPIYAYNLLKDIPFLEKALDIPYCHHEKWDGSGYPLGLKGEQIPLAARIFALVDVWDALLSDRPYRTAWPREQVIAYIQEQAGIHFDPQVVQIFLELVEQPAGVPVLPVEI